MKVVLHDDMKELSSIELVLRRDRAIIITGLLVLCAISWYYIIYLYNQMYPVMNMDAFLFAMPMSPEWTLIDFLLLFLMWFVMMIAMMIPSVAPLVLIYAMVNRQKKTNQSPYVPAGYFLSGYLVVWAVFSIAATALQWFFQNLDWLNPDMIVTNKILGGSILIVAGLFQFTSLKEKCLTHCQTPVSFIHSHWQNGRSGALKMGIVNGWYCLGCCWILMVILFVSGIMNLLWIALISLFVLVEKLLPGVKWVSYVAGMVLVIYGVLMITS